MAKKINNALTETTDNEVVENNEWLLQKLAPYFKVYPDEKQFHVTSDGQVFLEKGLNDAVNHQRRLDRTKEVISFTVE